MRGNRLSWTQRYAYRPGPRSHHSGPNRCGCPYYTCGYLWLGSVVLSWHRSTCAGDRMGHEWMGIVEEVGAQVRTIKKGDRVISPFLISDGTCEFCREGLPTHACMESAGASQ